MSDVWLAKTDIDGAADVPLIAAVAELVAAAPAPERLARVYREQGGFVAQAVLAEPFVFDLNRWATRRRAHGVS